MTSLNVTLPNPFTPMAFVPPALAYQVQVAGAIVVGAMGAYVWDILSNLSNDYKLLSSKKFTFGMGVYFMSRIWTFLYLLAACFFRYYPVNRCAFVQKLELIAGAIGVPTTSFLFFLRARAIFNTNTIFITFIFCAWLAVVGTSALGPIGIRGANIGPTAYCTTGSAKPYVAALAITPLIHDTIVFLAISWRLLIVNSYIDRENGATVNLRAFFTGKYLPHFSRAVFQDGQLYYLVSVASNLLTVAMFYDTNVSEAYRTMFEVPNVMVTNAMACNVFRNTKFGYHSRIVTTSDLKTRESASIIFMHNRTQKSNEVGTNIILRGGRATDVTDSTTDPAGSSAEKQKAPVV